MESSKKKGRSRRSGPSHQVARPLLTANAAALDGADLAEGDNPGHGDRRLAMCRHWITSFRAVAVDATLPASAPHRKTHCSAATWLVPV
jgi:hypothetical protein